MKTIDEVIESITKQSGLEIRNVRKPEKDRFWVDRETYNDALYYLREYRSEKVMWEADRKGYLDWIEQYKEAREKHQQAVIELKRNDPITWDELRQMEGNPVWVEILSDEIDLSSRWMMVARETKAHSLPLAYTDDMGHWIYGHEDDLGKTWQAYRKERG